MPNWKKVIVSGSNAVVNNITASGHMSVLSGSFTVEEHTTTELEVVGDISASINLATGNATITAKDLVANDSAIINGSTYSDKIGVGFDNTANSIQNRLVVRNNGTDQDDGILVQSENGAITTNDFLGGIGFDGLDSGNTPTSVKRAASFIGGFAAEPYGPSDRGGYLTFNTKPINDDTSDLTPERVRIDSDGFVGIGEISPDHILHIKGTNPQICIEETSTEFLRIGVEDTTGDMCIGWDDSDDLHLGCFNSVTDTTIDTKMLIKSDGKVGIGDPEPNQLLTVKGNNAQISIEESDTEFVRIGVEATSGDMCLGWDDSDDLHLGCFSSPIDSTIDTKMIIRSNGRVGIGDTAPESQLHVQISDATTNAASNSYSRYCLALRNNTDTQGAFAGIAFDVSTQTDSDSIGAAIKAVCADSNSSENHDTHLTFHTNTGGDSEIAERMRIKNDGRVVIGATSNSDAKLKIVTPNNTKALSLDVGDHAFFDFQANSTSGYTTIFNMDNTGLDIGHGSSARSLNLKTNSTDRLTITGGGAVGIGLSDFANHNNPAQKLHVLNTTVSNKGLVRFESNEANIDPTSGTSNPGDALLVLDFSGDSGITSGNDFIRFEDSGGEVGRIHSEVLYGNFTGAHVSQRPSGSDFSNWKTGMIVKSTGHLIATGSTIGLAYPEVDLTTTQKDKAVMGVWYENTSPGHNSKYLDQSLPMINYNALGEGMVLVTDTNGNIETGDYICSSTRLGHGEKQDDDLLHNYTVAKATQPYNFDSASIDSDLGYKSVLIACTYHCG